MQYYNNLKTTTFSTENTDGSVDDGCLQSSDLHSGDKLSSERNFKVLGSDDDGAGQFGSGHHGGSLDTSHSLHSVLCDVHSSGKVGHSVCY